MMRSVINGLSCAALLTLMAGSVAGQVQYTVTDLGALPGEPYSRATSINASGQIVGYTYSLTTNVERAFLFSNGTIQDLGTLPGLASAQALHINNSGQIAGWSYTSGGASFGFVYSNGTMQSIGTLPGGTWSQAYDINNNGQVAGYSYVPATGGHSIVYNNGTMQDLGTSLTINSINDGGQACGSLSVGSNQHACRFNNGVATDLGTLGARQATLTTSTIRGRSQAMPTTPRGIGMDSCTATA